MFILDKKKYSFKIGLVGLNSALELIFHSLHRRELIRAGGGGRKDVKEQL